MVATNIVVSSPSPKVNQTGFGRREKIVSLGVV